MVVIRVINMKVTLILYKNDRVYNQFEFILDSVVSTKW